MSSWRRRGLIAAAAIASGAVALVLLAATFDLGPSAGGPSTLWITDARLLDPATGSIEATNIVITDGIITAIDPPTAPTDLPVFDAGGAVVMPGLIDLHEHMLRAGHCGGDEGMAWDNIRQIPFNFDVALRHGVTTAVDLGGPLYGVIAVRDALVAEAALSPRYLVAGPLLTTINGYPFDWIDRSLAESFVAAIEMPNEAAARATVDRLAGAGVDLVKIAFMDRSYNDKPLPQLPPAVFKAAVDAAHAKKLRVFVHGHTEASYRAALGAGADVIAHSSFEPLPDALVADIALSGIVVVPTLWTFAAYEWARQHPEILDELRPQLMPTIFAALRDYDTRLRADAVALPADFLPGITWELLHRGVQNARQNLAQLAAAGVVIGFGTDTSFCYGLQGGKYRELAEMERAGMSRAQVLAAATLGSSWALGRSDLGRIEVGAVGDLLVLGGNPIDDLATVAAPVAVIQGGRVVRVAGTEIEPPAWSRAAATLRTLVAALYL